MADDTWDELKTKCEGEIERLKFRLVTDIEDAKKDQIVLAVQSMMSDVEAIKSSLTRVVARLDSIENKLAPEEEE